jgi:hypothetical protein
VCDECSRARDRALNDLARWPLALGRERAALIASPARTEEVEMPYPEETHAEPSVIASVGRVIEAGQRTVINRIDLARLDVIATVTRALRGGFMIVAGAVLAAVGWLALTAAAILMLNEVLVLPASAAVVGLFNAVLGGILIAAGTHRARPEAPRANGHNHRPEHAR